MYSEYEIRTLPLSLKSARTAVERFLASCQLRLDDVDSYAVVSRLDNDSILAGGGLKGNVIKCVAVSDELRGTGMMQRLLSHLLSEAHAAGHDCVKVFTKPGNQDIFESLGFRLLATAPQAIFMENGLPGIDAYLHQLAQLRQPGKNGVIVMNANPFTLGHQALVEWAASQVDHLYVIPVKEDCSTFSYDERRNMIAAGCRHLPNVTVCPGSDYAISAATFPTYFLKRIDDATDTQITLDLDLFARHIAPALGASARFVGSEPADRLTARYVELMLEQLPHNDISVNAMNRVQANDSIISASSVREHLEQWNLTAARALVPTTTWPHLVAHTATAALQRELDTTPKPGLVDRHDNGSHTDMDYALMQRSIEALHPHFVRLAQLGASGNFDYAQAQAFGIEAEKAMLQATGGVNTHKGALFAMGLTCVAAAMCPPPITRQALPATIARLAQQHPSATGTHGRKAVGNYGVKGALEMAQDGYSQLFEQWLPFYDSAHDAPAAEQRTLLRIMCDLDDTNVLHRCGADVAQEVKDLARQVLDGYSTERMQRLNSDFVARNISPGGAADMLSLTILVEAITCKNQETT
ncbi:MAG: [Muribaculaceae bacterium]|nr:[citrate (pro-3S)-lyase] ligase [Muribaculaceae bacterium]